MSNRVPIPIIDLFAGSGGLSEGFSSCNDENGKPYFKVALSIEKDALAHQTLQLRSFFRQFARDDVPEEYYRLLSQYDQPLATRLGQLYHLFPVEAENAKSEAWNTELGATSAETVNERIASALHDSDRWMLIGGPPCQAYSVVGRVRNSGNPAYVAGEDIRHFLYLEYLQVIADHEPAIFVMENVRGLLTASLGNGRIFERILDDLKSPSTALERGNRVLRLGKRSKGGARYNIVPITETSLCAKNEFPDYVVKMEDYGIPQARHRVILIGIREDLGKIQPQVLKKQPPVNINSVLNGLPHLRSGISKRMDTAEEWYKVLQQARNYEWYKRLRDTNNALFNRLDEALANLYTGINGRGAEYMKYDSMVGHEQKEGGLIDERICGVWNHETRSHIVEDLYRYLFAACFAKVEGRSPNLHDFPVELLPAHKNIARALEEGMFNDRFRVQVESKPSTTITSHISKDGHYFIHYDPSQCRSLTVREAARLQTFPDNYFFCGPRTSQYMQVGNAVPPLLARQVGERIAALLTL